MPKKAAKPKPRKRPVMIIQNGEGFMDVINSIGNFFKKTKIISTLAPLASMISGVGEFAAPIGAAAGALGLGKKKRKKAVPKKKKGKGLNPGGGALLLAGQRTPYR